MPHVLKNTNTTSRKLGNALCVMGTVAHHRKLEEIYNLLGTIQTEED